MLKNKKADEMITEQIIFIVLNILFFAALLFFVWRSASEDIILEETYAKKIALIIDSMQPGTNVSITISELLERADKNKIKEFPVSFDFEKNEIKVKITKGAGYNFNYFTTLKPENIEIPGGKKIFIIKT